MRCTNCQSQQMVKMALIANQIWKIKVVNEIKKNKYDKKSEKGINAFCGVLSIMLLVDYNRILIILIILVLFVVNVYLLKK